MDKTHIARIKNWKTFQHFKDRKPPWIKLYRDILDDLNWHRLAPADAKALVMFWLIASEYDGNLPPIEILSFRLRLSENQIKQHIISLSSWVEPFDISAISDRYQGDGLEAETETEAETKYRSQKSDRQTFEVSFDAWWKTVPRKVGKGQARKAYKSALKKPNVDEQTLLDGIRRYARENAEKEIQFVKHPATWLNGECWLDDTAPQPVNGSDAAWIDPRKDDFMLELWYRRWRETGFWNIQRGEEPDTAPYPQCPIPQRIRDKVDAEIDGSPKKTGAG